MPDVRFRDIAKTLLRSRSLSFTADIIRQKPAASLRRLRWGGRDVYYRPGTTDPFVLHQVLLKTGAKAEYYLPPRFRPDVILDIGSNIGASILYFHSQFPRARIIGVEPHPDTFRVLEANVGNIPEVQVANCGFGATNTRVAARAQTINFGAFATTERGGSRRREVSTIECELKRPDDFLEALHVSKIDLIKIDCEGAEADIFAAMPERVLTQCQWIVGELHDQTAFAVLARLAPQFQIDLKKKMFSPLFRFHACNNANAADFRGTFDSEALQR